MPRGVSGRTTRRSCVPSGAATLSITIAATIRDRSSHVEPNSAAPCPRLSPRRSRRARARDRRGMSDERRGRSWTRMPGAGGIAAARTVAMGDDGDDLPRAAGPVGDDVGHRHGRRHARDPGRERHLRRALVEHAELPRHPVGSGQLPGRPRLAARLVGRVLGGHECGCRCGCGLAVDLERRKRVLWDRRLAQGQERDQRRQERGAGQHTVQRPRNHDGTRPPAPAARLSRHGAAVIAHGTAD